jgi:hypothetical protein
MDPHGDFLLWHALYQLEAKYWHEVDMNGGRDAHEFFMPDGVMVVGDNEFRGQDRIKEFYQWRARQTSASVRTAKTMRHLINNLYVEASGDGWANVIGVVSFYGGSPFPAARQSKPPMLVADLANRCVPGEDGVWRFQSHTVKPVFMSPEVPLSIAIDTHRTAPR